ncbi:MAG TPA: protein kinase [Bryobacteraceae bacterium]|nr:protein kinase [Bryobacteraceae bacterium]
MTIAPGTLLGHYEMLAPLGAGGMGEVYRARDTKLGREVAIKILPAEVSDDADRLARFEREAKVLASLNHPNIAQIYGIVESGEARGIVMELVPGSILKGPIPLDTALQYAQQIAAALEAAHEKGVVHRDLKPANIMIAPGGVVKVLDFGLAAQTPAKTPVAELNNNSITTTMTTTRDGVILGTASYMSPEQARGEPVDKRADIWAFGVVLYEVLTGKKAFPGKTISDVLAAVLVAEPDLSAVPQDVSRLLRRCLEKDPHKRLRDIGDALSLVDDDRAPSGARAPSRLLWITAGGLLLIVVAAVFAWWHGPPPPELPQLRVDVDLGADVALATTVGSSNIVISPDGRRILYLAGVGGGQPRLWVRRLDQPGVTELSGSQGANSPFFSPDGEWAGFHLGDRIYKVPVEGGAAIALGAPGASAGSDWSEDGFIHTSVLLKGLVKTPSGGGALVSGTPLGANEFTFTRPQVLPGGKAILYTLYPEARNDSERTRIEVLSLADGRKSLIAQGGTSARFAPASLHSGYVLYTVKSKLFAVRFDLDNLNARTAPVSVLDDVAYTATRESQFDVSHNGTLVYRKSTGDPDQSITMIQYLDSSGGRKNAVSKAGVYESVSLSPDGKRLLAVVREGGRDTVQVYDFDRDTWTRVASDGKMYFHPTWSPDSQFVVLGSLTGLYWTHVGSGIEPQALLGKQATQVPASIVGTRLAYEEGSPNEGQLWTVPVEIVGGQMKAGTPEQFLRSTFKDEGPAISPDGKWMAYQSNSSGTDEIYVRAFPDNGSLWKISNSGGHHPIWSPKAHELFYQAGDQMLAVGYSDKNAAFVPEKPRVWLAKLGGTAGDVSLDGKLALVIVPVSSPNVSKPEHDVILFQNFVGYLAQRVPTGK